MKPAKTSIDTGYLFNDKRILARFENRIEDIKSKYYSSRVEDSYQYRPISLPMMTILTIIHYGECDARAHHKEFPGLTSKQIEDILSVVWNSVENVHNYLYRLTRLAYLDRRQYIAGASTRFYYRINPNRFPCHKGEYVFYYPDGSNEFRMIIGSCQMYQFCSCKPEACVFLSRLKEQLESYIDPLKTINLNDSAFFQYFTRQMTQWQRYDQEVDGYKMRLKQIFDSIGTNVTHIKDLYDQELIAYWIWAQSALSQKDAQEKNSQLREIAASINAILRQDKGIPIQGCDADVGFIPPDDIATDHDVDFSKDPTNGRGITPSMSNVIQIINLGALDAQKMNMPFPGLSSYQVEMLLEGLLVSKDVVSDCINRLTRLCYLNRNTYSQKTRDVKNHYFTINTDRFPCHLGTYILINPLTSSEHNVIITSCNMHLKCNLSACDCKLPWVLQQTFNVYLFPWVLCANEREHQDALANKGVPIMWHDTPFYQHLLKKMTQWQSDEENIEYYYNIVQKALVKYTNNEDQSIEIENDLIPAELIYYGKRIETLTSRHEIDALISELFHTTKKKREKQQKKYNKQTKEDIADRQVFKEKLLDLLLTTPIDKKLEIDF